MKMLGEFSYKHMGIGRRAVLAARNNGLALAGLATIFLTSVVGTGDPLDKCRGKVVLDACRNVVSIYIYSLEQRPVHMVSVMARYNKVLN